MHTHIPLFQFPPSLESEVAARAQAYPHYAPDGALVTQGGPSRFVEPQATPHHAHDDPARPSASPHAPRFAGEPEITRADAHSHRHQHVRPDTQPSYVSPSPALVKHEDVGEHDMLWHEDEQQMYEFAGDADAAYECKHEIDWAHTQMHPMHMQPGLYVDTSAMSMSHCNPFDAPPYMTDSPMSMDGPELPPPMFPARFPVPANTRSYTLEGAITPITPPPHAAFPAAHATTNPRTPSPPPMGSLLPPTPSHVKTEPHAAVVPPAPAPTPAAAPVPVQKRPRGRPRKNPPSARPASPPPVVDYPFPHFPSASSPAPASLASPSSTSSAMRAGDVTVPIPNMFPAPMLTVGTAGASGPLPAGQAVFRLNVHREGDGAAGGAGADGREAEKKKPVMACFFCRERKIACGAPAPGGPRRCNQCTRRDLVCEYPKESRRGQHKRGTRAARVEALASASAPSTSAPASASTPAASAKGKAKAPAALDTPSPSLDMDFSPDMDLDFSPEFDLDTPGSSAAPTSPLSPLSPHSPTPQSPLGAVLASVATERARPSRSDKVVRAQERGMRGKERSGSRAREGWDAAAVRVQQQRRRAGGVGRDSELALAMGMR